MLECLGFPSRPDVETDQAGSWTSVVLQDDHVYSHKIMRANYTTYDVRRDEDVLHVETPQCNIMLLNSAYKREADLHPFLYARILNIFHANVLYVGQLPDGTRSYTPHRIEFLWVRWYELLTPRSDEFVLDRLSLCPFTSNEPLGFIDPANVLRSVHLIPQFSLGKFDEVSPRSRWVGRQEAWKAYYINQFVLCLSFSRLY